MEILIPNIWKMSIFLKISCIKHTIASIAPGHRLRFMIGNELKYPVHKLCSRSVMDGPRPSKIKVFVITEMFFQLMTFVTAPNESLTTSACSIRSGLLYLDSVHFRLLNVILVRCFCIPIYFCIWIHFSFERLKCNKNLQK